MIVIITTINETPALNTNYDNNNNNTMLNQSQ